jgi:DNA invertase Pin-like site-specific DNA recombinase
MGTVLSWPKSLDFGHGRSKVSDVFNAFYVRVSRVDQTPENQVLELERAGYLGHQTFTEHGVSGSTKALERPEFSEMLRTFARLNGNPKKRLYVTKVDRLGRKAKDVLETVDKLRELGISTYVLQLGETDLTSSSGRLILTVLAAVAEMERDLLIERTKAGLERSKKTKGRPRALSRGDAKAVTTALAENASVASLAKKYGVARATIRRLRQAA